MKIEFWSDIICPYCGLMDHRLHLVQDRFEHPLEIVHRSFQLHPDLPRDGITQRDLFATAGVPAEVGIRTIRQIEESAEADGLTPYHALDRTLGPTDYAHEMLAYATDQGRGNEIWSAMFRAHFGEPRALWTIDAVLRFAGEVGLDGAAEALTSRRHRDQVQADQREAERLGAQGMPFIVLDERYAIPGAIATGDLLAAVTKAWSEHTPKLSVIGGAEGVCGPDGCAVSFT
jgi:predicted DsbA family dithiol-disulfide isomerase